MSALKKKQSMTYWKYKKMEEVLEMGISKGIDMKIHKTFHLSTLPLIINIMKICASICQEEWQLQLYLGDNQKYKYPSIWE